MKSTAKKILLSAISLLTMLMLLCACGSDLDGTWTSNSDKNTKIKFSGNKVKVSYGSFKLSGTYETDEEDETVITMNLADENGTKYRIVAKKSFGNKNSSRKKGAEDEIDDTESRSGEKNKNILILQNPATGDKETFKK